jgi:ATP-dependent DNA ligase
MARRYVLDYDGAGAHERTLADGNTWADEGFGADPRVVADNDWRFDQRKERIGEIMRTAAEVRSVRNRDTIANADRSQAVNENFVTDCRPIADDYIPRHVKSRTRIDVNLSTDLSAEQA